MRASLLLKGEPEASGACRNVIMLLLSLTTAHLLLSCNAIYIFGGLRRKGSENFLIPPDDEVVSESSTEEEPPWWFISETGRGHAARVAQRLAQRQEPWERPWWFRSDTEDEHLADLLLQQHQEAQRAAQQQAPQVDAPRHAPAIVNGVDDPLPYQHGPSDQYYIPACLRFVEGLGYGLMPDEVVIFTGGDSIRRRLSGYGQVSANSIEAFANHHGYRLFFLDQLNYDRSLIHRGEQFCNYWHRVFALPALRAAAPRAKYIVWFDDDILVPHKETDMLNHYINMMHIDKNWQMTYAAEGGHYELNSGMFIIKNRDFAHDAYQRGMDIGWATKYKTQFGYEQDAIKELRKNEGLYNEIRIINHRDGNYNFNNFARRAAHDPPGTRAEFGDAFVHFTGLGADHRLKEMNKWLAQVDDWRYSLPEFFALPVNKAD